MNVLLVDGNSLAHRGFYGSPYQFFNMVNSLIKIYRINQFAFAFDDIKPSFRKEIYPAYKEGRKKDEAAREYVSLVQRLLALNDYPCYVIEGYEADDILASLATLCVLNGLNPFIASGDTDMLAMVSEEIKVIGCGKDRMLYDQEAVENKYGVRPDQLEDYKALTGEIGDNIPGVKGIGPVAARRLLNQFDSLDNIYNNLFATPYEEKLIQGRSNAFLSRRLTGLVRNIPLTLGLSSNLSFNSVVKELKDYIGH